MSAAALNELTRGDEIGNYVYEGKRNSREVAIKLIKNKEKAQTEINVYESHDNAQNIVCLYDSSTHEDYVELVLERAKCSLFELVDFFCENQPNATKIKFMKSIDPKTLWKTSTLPNERWKTRKQTPLLLDLIRDIVYGLEDLQKKNFIHQFLEPSNIMIFEHLGRLSAKISMSRGGNKLWRAPEQIRGEPITLGVDLFGLGLIIHFFVSKGLHPMKKEKIQLSSNISEEMGNLIFNLLEKDVKDRLPNTYMVLAHPVFWSPTRRMLFYCEVSRKLSIVYDWEITKTLSEDDQKINTCQRWLLESESRDLFGGPNWNSQIDEQLWNHLNSEGVYVVNGTKDLVRFIRNSYEHRNDVEIQEIVGETHSSIDEYFGKKFPKLLIRLYEVAREYWLNDEIFNSFIMSGL